MCTTAAPFHVPTCGAPALSLETWARAALRRTFSFSKAAAAVGLRLDPTSQRGGGRTPQFPTEKCLRGLEIGWPRWPSTALQPRRELADSSQVKGLPKKGCLKKATGLSAEF